MCVGFSEMRSEVASSAPCASPQRAAPAGRTPARGAAAGRLGKERGGSGARE